MSPVFWIIFYKTPEIYKVEVNGRHSNVICVSTSTMRTNPNCILLTNIIVMAFISSFSLTICLDQCAQRSAHHHLRFVATKQPVPASTSP